MKLNTKDAIREVWLDIAPRVLVKGGHMGQQVWMDISFQDGLVKEVGVNGICMLDVLQALIDRLKQFDKVWPCRENKAAIERMHETKDILIAKRDRLKKERDKAALHE